MERANERTGLLAARDHAAINLGHHPEDNRDRAVAPPDLRGGKYNLMMGSLCTASAAYAGYGAYLAYTQMCEYYSSFIACALFAGAAFLYHQQTAEQTNPCSLLNRSQYVPQSQLLASQSTVQQQRTQLQTHEILFGHVHAFFQHGTAIPLVAVGPQTLPASWEETRTSSRDFVRRQEVTASTAALTAQVLTAINTAAASVAETITLLKQTMEDARMRMPVIAQEAVRLLPPFQNGTEAIQHAWTTLNAQLQALNTYRTAWAAQTQAQQTKEEQDRFLQEVASKLKQSLSQIYGQIGLKPPSPSPIRSSRVAPGFDGEGEMDVIHGMLSEVNRVLGTQQTTPSSASSSSSAAVSSETERLQQELSGLRQQHTRLKDAYGRQNDLLKGKDALEKQTQQYDSSTKELNTYVIHALGELADGHAVQALSPQGYPGTFHALIKNINKMIRLIQTANAGKVAAEASLFQESQAAAAFSQQLAAAQQTCAGLELAQKKSSAQVSTLTSEVEGLRLYPLQVKQIASYVQQVVTYLSEGDATKPLSALPAKFHGEVNNLATNVFALATFTWQLKQPPVETPHSPPTSPPDSPVKPAPARAAAKPAPARPGAQPRSAAAQSASSSEARALVDRLSKTQHRSDEFTDDDNTDGEVG